MVHVGDDYEHDFAIPASVGIRSFLINRSGKLKEDYVVNNLYDFEGKSKAIKVDLLINKKLIFVSKG